MDLGLCGPLEGAVGGEKQTANRAELRAVIAYFQMRPWEASGADRIVIATDCASVIDNACVGLDRWVSSGWRTSRGLPVSDSDQWKILKR